MGWPWRRVVAAALAIAWCAAVTAASADGMALKCQRKAKFGVSVAPLADPGQLVDLDVIIFKKSKCFAKPAACMLLLDAPDGAAVSTAYQGLATQATVNSDFSQSYVWSLSNLTAYGRGVYQDDKHVATVYSVLASADLCAPRATLPFTVSLVVKSKPRSAAREKSSRPVGHWRPGKTRSRETKTKTCTKTFAVAVPGGSAEPVDRSITQPCNLLGCKTCLRGSDSKACQRCEDGWQLTPKGTCECAPGAGTYVTTAFETTLPYPGFTDTQPVDACLYRIDNPMYTSALRRAEHCSGANPRVLQHSFVDSPACQCRPCPAGWTSSGGPPKVAFCYPTVLPRYFKMEVELTTPNNYSQYDFTNLSTAASVVDAFAQTMVAVTSGVRRYGTLRLLPPTGQPPQESAFGVQPRETSIFATIYTFNDTEADLTALVSAAQSCRALGNSGGCASCQWNLCRIFNATAPSSVLDRLGLAPIATSVFDVPPSLDPLDYPDTLARSQRRRLLDDLQIGKNAIGFSTTVFTNGGKLGQLFSDKKFKEFGGLALGSTFAVAGFVLSFFSSPQPDPTKELLKSINQTVTATYHAVLQIQDELQTIALQLDDLSQQLETIFNILNAEIYNNQCLSAYAYAQSLMQNIQRVYLGYCGVDLDSDRIILTEGTVMQAMSEYLLDVQAGANFSTNSQMRRNYQLVNSWADATTDLKTTFADLQLLSSTLTTKKAGQDSPLEICANAIFTSWQTYGRKSPVDDRQYYTLIYGWMVTLIDLQTQGMQMLQAAHLYRAAQNYINDAQGDPDAILRSLSPDFCYYAVRAKRGTPLASAASNCKQYDEQTKAIYNNLILQLQQIGAPLSTGGPSEGTRLLLGTEITRVKAALVANANSAVWADQDPVNTPTTTQYLLAAGAKAFDPRCANPSISQAQAAGCSTLGTFASCGTGCGLNPRQEQLWADANGGYFGSYPTSLWYPAGADVWQQLRGTLTNMIPAGATGAAGDTMALLSDNTSAINLGTNAVEFNMKDRTYWINNATAMANMQQIMMGTYQVNRTSFVSTYTYSLSLGCPGGDDGNGNCKDLKYMDKYSTAQFGPYIAGNTQSPATASPGTVDMPFTPSITFPGAQCFAASNPTSNNGRGTIGRGSGTSGVFCSYTDFPALYDQACSTRGNYLCSDRYLCDVGIRDSLVHSFRDVFGSMQGVKVRSTCAWNPFPATVLYGVPTGVNFFNVYDKLSLIRQDISVIPEGHCSLVGPPNPRYLEGCAESAKGNGRVQGSFTPNIGDTGCQDQSDKAPCYCKKSMATNCARGSSETLTWACNKISTTANIQLYRKRTYQCSGGKQSDFALNSDGTAKCLNTAIGRLAGNYGQYQGAASSTFYGPQDPTWCPMQPDCLNTFTYPWFPNVTSPDRGNWLDKTFVPPQPGFIMFRLPAMTIANRTCTPSPFVNSTLPADRNKNRPAYAQWNGIVPTQCNNDMTLSITSLIGPGYYTAPVGQGANVTLTLGPDNNTVTCTYTLGSSLPVGLAVQSLTIVATDGPVFANDDPLYSGNPSSPYWQLGFKNVSSTAAPSGSGSVLLSQMLNGSVARSYTRVVDCVVAGVNAQTGLPFSLTAAQPYVVETYGQGWLPYSYPMPGTYNFSGPPTPAPTTVPTQRPTAPTVAPTQGPTRQPSNMPSARPTLRPTQDPTRQPTQMPSTAPTLPPTLAPSTRPTLQPTQVCVAPLPTPPLFIGFSILSPATTSGVVVPGQNTFSGYTAGSPIIDYNATAGLLGGWDNTNFEYVAPSAGVYHFNYVARFQNATGGTSVQGQRFNGSAWVATFSQPLWAWNEGQARGYFVAWATEILMSAGDKFRVVNSPMAGPNITLTFQQLSGYFAGVAPLGAQATFGPANVRADSNMFAAAPFTKGYENTGNCSAAGFQAEGYIAPRSGLYQIQYAVHYNSTGRAGVVPLVNGLRYEVLRINDFIAPDATNASWRLLTFSLAVYLSSGGVFGLNASFSADASTLGQQFSAHYVGDSVAGFSVRYTTAMLVFAGQSVFADARPTDRKTDYSQGGGYNNTGYTAPLTGPYQFNYMAFYLPPAAGQAPGGFTFLINGQALPNQGAVYSWYDPIGNRYQTYALAVSLNAGDVVTLAATSNMTSYFQGFSGYYIGQADNPTLSPTHGPSTTPTQEPTTLSSVAPSKQPSSTPTFWPTQAPSTMPTRTPTMIPSAGPTRQPTQPPTKVPTSISTLGPSNTPTVSPVQPSSAPPTQAPTLQCDGFSNNFGGQCGIVASQTICCHDASPCCSSGGFCGSGSLYCDAGCQPRYGICN